MDRYKEIREASEKSHYNGEILYKDGFIDGARWSDENNVIRWIDIEEGLPVIGERVLLMDYDGNISIGELGLDNEFSIENVKYWMLIPEIK